MIQLEGIHKTYPRPGESPLHVLKDIQLQVAAGEQVALVGPSGSGKSTLMNILGLLDRPDSGEYLLDGIKVSGLDSSELAAIRNKKLGFVFQQFHLLARTTAVENVALPLLYSDVDNPRERAIEALCRVGLEDRLTHFPNQLSGGQQQRVAIARALVNDPDLILADEPTGNLDRDTGGEIMDLFAQLNARGRTILIITHDPELAARAGRMLSIDDGILAPPKDQRVLTFSGGQ